MIHSFGRNTLAVICGLPLLLTGACSAQPSEGVARGVGQVAGTACPTAGPPAFLVRGMMMLPGSPKIKLSSSTEPSDTSTSTVISPDPQDQIRCSKTEIKTTPNVVFSTPSLSDGKTKALKMDILTPASGGIHPLVIYVPGGGFMIAPKEGALDMRTYVAESGFVVASIQYRTLGDHAGFRDSIADVKSAIRYLRAHASEYGIDPTKVGIWGESAGGYLVAMVGVTGDVKTFDKGDNLDQSSKVQAVVDKFGTSDMSKIAADFDPETKAYYYSADNPIAKFVNGPASTKGLQDDPIVRTTANPITYINASDPAFLIFSGSQDRIISPTQTLMLHNALTAAGVHSTRYVLKGAGHGDMAFLGDAKAGLPWTTNQVMGIIVDFLQRQLSQGQTNAK